MTVISRQIFSRLYCYALWSVAAICHKSWGSRPQAASLPPSILLSSLPSWTPQRVWTEPAHPLPNILMQFIQSNSLIKSTLMLLSVPQKSACMHSSATVSRTDTMDYRPCRPIAISSMALKMGRESVHIWIPRLPESGGQDPSTPTGSPHGLWWP